MEGYQLVLYYKKKVVGVVPTVEYMISEKEKSGEDFKFNDILDEYNDKLKNSEKNAEIVNSWVFIDDDKLFFDKVKEFESSNGFMSWDKNSKNIISKKMMVYSTTKN